MTLSLHRINHQSQNSLPIGIFDSGVGGLSIAKCIRQELPNEELIYIADAQFAPYGCKSADQIIERVNCIAAHFVTSGVKAMVIACNTATVNAIDQLRERYQLPIIGIEPGIKPAALASKTKAVGLLVTSATANNQRFLQLVKNYSADVKTYIQPCPGLVELIENNQANSPKIATLLEQYLAPLLKNNIDQVVLGCTHYPFLTEQISRIIGNKVSIIETAQPVTNQLKRQLTAHGLLNTQDEKGKLTFFTTGQIDTQAKIVNLLWSEAISVNFLPLNNQKNKRRLDV